MFGMVFIYTIIVWLNDLAFLTMLIKEVSFVIDKNTCFDLYYLNNKLDFLSIVIIKSTITKFW